MTTDGPTKNAVGARKAAVYVVLSGLIGMAFAAYLGYPFSVGVAGAVGASGVILAYELWRESEVPT